VTATLPPRTAPPGDLTGPPPASAAGRPSVPPRVHLARAGRWLRARRRSGLVLGPLLAVIGVVQGLNMTGTPQRIDDEGTYVAQAYAVLRFGELTHYTYWYDHPPLGWLQLAAYAGATGAFERAPNAVAAGREAMLVAALVSAALLWVLARRLGLSRVFAGLAVALFGLSPLAVEYHRIVYLDNVATPWLLGALVLALSPRKRLVAVVGSAACFGVAVLTKETYLLVLPVLAWLLWRHSDRTTRRYGLAVAASLFVLIGAGYVLFALVKGELVPSRDRVSLAEGVGFQLAGRSGSGSLLDPGSLTRRTLRLWLDLDVVLPALSVLAAAVGVAVRRLRPFAVGTLLLLALALRPGGYLPVPYVVGLLPLGALLVAGVADAAWRHRRTAPGAAPAAGLRAVALARPGTAVVVVGALVAGALAVPMWGARLRGQVLSDLDAPLAQAEAWIGRNVRRDARLIVDDALWVDLVRQGRDRENVVWYYKLDTDPAVQALSPRGWRDYDYIVSTNSIRTFPHSSPEVGRALESSTLAAAFGEGATRVEVRRVNLDGAEGAGRRLAADRAARSAAGTALMTSPRLTASQPARDLLRGGYVDARVLTTLVGLSTRQPLTVDGFPGEPGEAGTDEPRRAVRITRVGDEPVAPGSPADLAVREFLAAQPDPYRPARIEALPGGGLLVDWSAPSPTGLLGAPG